MTNSCAPLATPVLGFAAFSGTGKTTLLRQVIPVLRARGRRLGLLKHSHDACEIDRPGKDSFLLRQAGATQIVVASRQRTVMLADHDSPPTLANFLQRLDHPSLDLILVEGYKHAAIAKIELHRPSLGQPLLALTDSQVIAVASDAPLPHALAVPLLDLNDPAAIAEFILARYPAKNSQ